MSAAEELGRLLQEAGVSPRFGLRQQGHMDTVWRMLHEGASWDDIAAVIRWSHGEPVQRMWEIERRMPAPPESPDETSPTPEPASADEELTTVSMTPEAKFRCTQAIAAAINLLELTGRTKALNQQVVRELRAARALISSDPSMNETATTPEPASAAEESQS